MPLRLTLGYHGLFRIAFCDMHKSATGSITDIFCQGALETTELVPATALVDDVTEPEAYKKALRIKSYKTYEWLCKEATVFHLLICAVTNSALEHIMHTFMLWQRDEFWLVPGKSPLILMANSSLSPATKACSEIHGLMTRTQCPDSHGSLEALAQGLFVVLFNILF